MPETTPIVSVEGLRLTATSAAIDTTVAERQIVGLAGLDGHGQARFIEALVGLQSVQDGSVTVATDQGAQRISSYADAGRAGLVYLPADRKKNGIFPTLGVADNFLLGSPDSLAPGGWISPARVNRRLEEFRRDLSMSFASPSTRIRNLSGGNQQKVLLARIMAANPRVLVLNDPTRGVDIQTRHALYGYFRRAVSELGMTIILLSTELDELVELCDRVLVFREFGVFAELERMEVSLDGLMQAMFGHGEEAEA